MRLLTLAILVTLVGIEAPIEAGPRHGKIVRVERPRTGARGTPRICQLREGDNGMCWGKPPVVGETASVLDSHKHRGKITITEVTASDDGCSMPQYWSFRFDARDADVKDMEPWQTWVLLDVDVAPAARVLDGQAVKAPDDQNAWLAVDRGRGEHDGESEADFLVVAFQCDAQGQQQSSGGYGGYCLDYWNLTSGRWSKIRRDVVVNCQR